MKQTVFCVVCLLSTATVGFAEDQESLASKLTGEETKAELRAKIAEISERLERLEQQLASQKQGEVRFAYEQVFEPGASATAFDDHLAVEQPFRGPSSTSGKIAQFHSLGTEIRASAAYRFGEFKSLWLIKPAGLKKVPQISGSVDEGMMIDALQRKSGYRIR